MRSVVLKPTPRCPRCQLPPRWCLCAAEEQVQCALQIDLLLHQRELGRPTSTGRLIKRIFPDSGQHVWQPDAPLREASVLHPERELWILHPSGEALPQAVDPSGLQVLLLDGLWNETATMARATASWGRLVQLPMQGVSRYWLRAQQEGGRFSTAEALLFLLEALQLHEAHAVLQRQFELHVYAGLRARGRTDLAAAFLAGSALQKSMPEAVAALQQRRALEEPVRRP
jgi:DTW domain-containing protein YfiP